MASKWDIVDPGSKWEVAEQRPTEDSDGAGQPWRIVAQGVGGAVGGMVGASSLNPILTAVGIGLGDAIGGQVYDLGEDYLRYFMDNKPDPIKTKLSGDKISERVKELSFGEQATKGVIDFGLGAMMPEAMRVSGSAALKAGKGMLSPIKRGLMGKTGPMVQNYDEVMQAVNKMGMQPTAGMVSDNPSVQSLQQSLRQTPGGGSVMYGVEQGNVKAAEDFALKTAEKYGAIRSPVSMGGEVREAAKAAKAKFWTRSGELFDDVARYLPEDEMIDVQSTRRFFEENTPETPLEKRLLGNLNAVREDFLNSLDDNGQLGVRTLRRIKSRLGKVFDKAGPGDISTYDQKQLVFAMGDDLATAATGNGGEAAAAAKKANLYYRLAKGNKKLGVPGHLDVIDTILSKTEDGTVYTWITGELNKGSSRITRAFNQLPGGVKNDVRATVLYQSGLATKGRQGALGDRFSFQTFLTNWNKMSSEAKSFLWGGKGFKQYERDIHDIAMVSDFMKDLQGKANYSNTANVNMWHALRDAAIAPMTTGAAMGGTFGGLSGGGTGLAIGAAAGVGRTMATLGVQHRQAKLLTDPRFIKWLADAGRQSVQGTNFLPYHMVKLSILAQTQPELTDAITGYVNNLQLPEDVSMQLYGVPGESIKVPEGPEMETPEDPNIETAKQVIREGRDRKSVINRMIREGYTKKELEDAGL